LGSAPSSAAAISAGSFSGGKAKVKFFLLPGGTKGPTEYHVPRANAAGTAAGLAPAVAFFACSASYRTSASREPSRVSCQVAFLA